MRNLILTLAILSAICCMAQRTATDFFTSAPTDVFPYIDNLTRLDMVDYFHAGSATASKNQMGGNSRIFSEERHSLICQLADSVRCQVAVVTSAPSDTIICVIQTVKLPMADSRVDFYNTDWSRPKKLPLAMPGIADWMPDKAARAKAREDLPFITAEWVYNPADLSLTATPTIEGYFYSKETPECVKHILPQLKYVWTGKNFAKSKK